jgi:hypothetical protein
MNNKRPLAIAFDPARRQATLGLLLAATLLLFAQSVLANTPTIRLFPTTVVEDLKQTGNVARDMETGLQEVIGRLDQQQQLYVESKCDGAENDPGCQRLARQIGATYLEMLTIMEERLPDMEHTVNNTRISLERGLRNELGKKMTPWQLQETLVGKTAASAPAQSSPTLRGRSGMRLSERFKQYYQLVATSGSQSDQSLAVLASDIYLDTHGTAQPVLRHHHAGNDGSRRRRQDDPVRGRRRTRPRCGATAGQRRASLPQSSRTVSHG